MGFIIEDLKNEDNKLRTSAWNWGPTVELIRQMNLLDADRSEMIRYNCSTEISAEEAQKIGKFLYQNVLVVLKPDERVNLDLSKTNEPDDGTFHREDLQKNYGATYDWLKEFADFCLNGNGFTVF